MSTSINIGKQSVKELLSSGKIHKFSIPEYQRPYAWSIDEVETLFNDLWSFAEKGEEKTYFLGSIVSYTNGDVQEIIDGQQRITTLFLLLRAIYTKLNEPEIKTPEAQHFIKEIAPTIWKTNQLNGEIYYNEILIESKVVNNEGNEILKQILETGVADEKAKDNYSINYLKLKELYEQASQYNPMLIYNFILSILENAILLPITADSQETALTIFSTLNDRGLPLSDADIFKAQIYKNLDKSKTAEFIKTWQNLEEDSKNASESIQSLFYYYMFYLRAKENDSDTTTPGVRKFFFANNQARLLDSNLLENLRLVLNMWKIVNNRTVIDEEKWSEDKEVLKVLDILKSYPNEFWKYPVVSYYLVHRNENDFSRSFAVFLRKLTQELVIHYLYSPTINAVKSDILKLNVDIIKSSKPDFKFKEIDKSIWSSNIENPNSKSVRMLLKILAYNKQDSLLPETWEIEHIFPQKWHDNYFVNEPDELVKEKIEYLGNKIPFEKKLNIKAGNGYFTKKQGEYATSDIVITKELSDKALYKDWNLDDITRRGIKISDEIKSTLEQWNSQYIAEDDNSNEPSAEELEQIAMFKAKGWI